MDYAHPRYFDYFEDYGDILGAQLEYSGLAAKVAIWRKNGLEDPDSAATGCRKVLEHVLDRLINDTDLTRGAKLIDKIDLAKRKRLISGSFVKKFHMIRKMGNRGAHACIDTVSASKSLVLLDEVLRKYVHDQIDPQVIPDIAIYDDTPFRRARLGRGGFPCFSLRKRCHFERGCHAPGSTRVGGEDCHGGKQQDR